MSDESRITLLRVVIRRWICAVLGHQSRPVILTETVAIRMPPGLEEDENGTIFGIPTVPGTYSRYPDGRWVRRVSSDGQRMLQCQRCGDVLYRPAPLRAEPRSVDILVVPKGETA